MFQGRILKAKALSFSSLFLLTVSFGTMAYAKKIESVPGEYVVKLKSGVQIMSVRQMSQRLKAQVVEALSPASHSVLVRRPLVEKSEFALQELNHNPMVEYAEPNFIYHAIGGAMDLPNDPDLEKLWGLINSGQKSSGDMGDIESRPGIDINAKKAWQIETGRHDVVIASIDTGVDYTLESLAPNIWVNLAEANGQPGVDDDGNGIVDDIYGYNAIENNGNSKDDHGHGSHTSGTLAARGNDGIGPVGVVWDAQIMGVKFLSALGSGTLADAVKAIDYTTAMKVTMTTNSWGGGGYSQQLYDAIQRARDAGILFIAAAGNEAADNDNEPGYPASYDLDNIISVAAIDSRGELAEFSSYGKTSVHVAAPGVNIYSVIPKEGMVSWSGTSMATPHVTGVAALLKSAFPEMTYLDIKERIIKTARPLASLRGRVVSGGLVDAYNALTDTIAPTDPEDPFGWTKQISEVSTPHPYVDNYANSWTLQVEGASQISLHFSRFYTESDYDKVTFKDAEGQIVGVWSGKKDDSYSPVIQGNTVVVEFTSDNSVHEYGFDIDHVAFK